MKSKLFLVLLSVGALCVLLSGCPPVVAPTIPAEKSSDKAILSFSFATPAAEGATSETAHTVSVQVPAGTALTALVPTITVSPGATVDPASGVAQDFTAVVNYTVTAEDGTTQGYAVAVYHAVPRDGLVGEWLFGGDLADTSVSGDTGSAIGSPVLANDRFATADHAYSFNGSADGVAMPSTYGSIVDNFTISIWARPEATITIDTEATSGISGMGGQRYLVGAIHSASAYSDSCSCAGISCGTNGISVYEHTDMYIPALLVWEGTVSDWTHIVVVYHDDQPSLYVNGMFEKNGLTSTLSVHPSALIGFCSTYGWYQGDADDMRVYNRALTDVEIEALYHENGWSGQ